MNIPESILVADDNDAVRLVVTQVLRVAGYVVAEEADGARVVERVLAEKPGLLVLDVEMPGMSGWSVVEELRRRGQRQPVLMLTSHTGITERVRGLNAGADDFLSKPFDQRELVARVQALLRRTRTDAASSRQLVFGEVQVDLTARVARRGADPVALTKTEFDLLELLAQNPGRPVSREQMLLEVWGYTVVPDSRTVETHIYRLRKKLGEAAGEPRWIRTVASATGYALAPECVMGSGDAESAPPGTLVID